MCKRFGLNVCRRGSRQCAEVRAAPLPEQHNRDKKVSSRPSLSPVGQRSHAQFFMNYIRGAVYAISAPYQYYKELAPLNPSTLTGAIDVIVVRRPTEDGTDVELASSPFHVRFGKWQVLRPADKKVRTSPNDLKPVDRPANNSFRLTSLSMESTSRST